MSTLAEYNAIWLLCIVLLIIAFFLAIKRRKLNNTNNNIEVNSYEDQMAYNGQEVRVNDVYIRNVASSSVQPPPPIFNPEEQPPPSYQEFRKDIRIQPNN